jgi:exosortase A-associated hydrolase 1
VALLFASGKEKLVGILHLPDKPARVGLIIVVGGAQYRVGSHRQFVLVARELATHGVPVMRFDYKGMGDSEGELGQPEPCEHLDSDIRAAVDALLDRLPDLEKVVLWGLCDGASAILLYAHHDSRIRGAVLLNPWIRTSSGHARSVIKHYYFRRLADPDLWRKILKGEFHIVESVKSILLLFATAGGSKVLERPGAEDTMSKPTLSERMAEGLDKFRGRVLLVLSGRDLVAAEFKDTLSVSPTWRRLIGSKGGVTRLDYPEANHTFSRDEWRRQVTRWTKDWILCL